MSTSANWGCRRLHTLSGAIFPIYDEVIGSSGIQTFEIGRATLADVQALVGLILSASDVPNVKLRFGIGTLQGEASSAEIFSPLISGAVIELDNGGQLTPARVAGDEVGELVLNGVSGKQARVALCNV